MFEPAEVHAAQCSSCGEHTLEFETDVKGVVLCWDCLEAIMTEGDQNEDKYEIE